MNRTLSATDVARGRIVPWIITGFFISFILPLLIFTWIAFKHKPDLVTERAYDKGLAYNNTLASEAQMEALGWNAQMSLQTGVLVVQLSDKNRMPLKDASVKAWFMRPANASMDQSTTMREITPGHYEAAMLHPTAGFWQVRITVEHHGQQFQAMRDFSVK